MDQSHHHLCNTEVIAQEVLALFLEHQTTSTIGTSGKSSASIASGTGTASKSAASIVSGTVTTGMAATSAISGMGTPGKIATGSRRELVVLSLVYFIIAS